MWVYNIDDLKTAMEDPKGEDIHHNILRFLDESLNELLCIMTPGEWDAKGHCTAYREAHGLENGQVADCWENYYNTKF